MSNLADLEQQVLFGARVLPDQINDIWGHVTARLPEDDDRQGFLLKHLRISPPPSDPDELMVFDYHGRKLQGSQEDPWEIPIYTAVYRARPDVHSVIHVHPPVATALTTAGQTIHAVSHEGWEFGEGLPAISGEMVDNDEHSAKMAAALGQQHACMLRGHGAVIVGTSVPDAVVKTIYLERTAKQMVWASNFGTPDVLPEHIRSYLDRRRGPNHIPLLWNYLLWKSSAGATSAAEGAPI